MADKAKRVCMAPGGDPRNECVWVFPDSPQQRHYASKKYRLVDDPPGRDPGDMSQLGEARTRKAKAEQEARMAEQKAVAESVDALGGGKKPAAKQ